MSNVFSLTQPCDYMVKRAARHRMAGRYDEAMTLLARARDEYGTRAEIEQEMALVYEEMGCDEEAARSWRRIVQLGGEPRVTALFELAVISLRNADIRRAQAYFEQYAALGNSTISPEVAGQVYEQITAEANRPAPVTRRGRARALERRAARCLQAGRIHAAAYALHHAIRLWPTAQGFTLLGCTMLMLGDAAQAVVCAETAHELAPGRVQAICVLADALAAAGEAGKARRMLHIAALRAKTPDDLYGVAMESAKRGEDALTLRMTSALLAVEPCHTHAMMMRACALANTGRWRQARRLFGRLCRLLPENTVCEALYRLASEGNPAGERLSLGIEVPAKVAAGRVAELAEALYDHPAEAARDRQRERRLCRLCAWAIRSPLVVEQAAALALLVLGGMQTQGARGVMTDALMDPAVDDAIKMDILQILTAREGMQPLEADIGGKPVRLLASGTIARQGGGAQHAGTQIVQRAADALAPRFPDAPQMMLSAFIAYLRVYGAPKGRLADACVTALKYAYCKRSGIPIPLAALAREDGVSRRLCRLCLRRLERAAAQGDTKPQDTEEHDHEMH